MKINQEQKNDVMICKIEGEINLNTSPELRKIFDTTINKNIKKVLVDFSQVGYIDSSGLATLIELFQRLKKIDGKLRICDMQDKVKNVFEITKLHKLFEIYDSQEMALEGF
jgi:anti-sigma B factor antagonist